MKTKRFFPYGFVVLIVSFSSAFAEELHYLYRGTRVLGMGTAFTAVADDENALFFNTAGLGQQTDKLRIAILNPKMETSTNAISFIQDIVNLDGEDVTQATALLEKHAGEHQRVATDLFPHVIFNLMGVGVGLGVLGTAEVNLDIINAKRFPEFRTDTRATYGGVIGAGYRLPGSLDFMQLGMGLKLLSRKAVIKTFDAEELTKENYQIADELKDGFGYGYDFGLILYPEKLAFLKPAQFLKPTFGLSFQNAGDIEFDDAGKEVGNLAVGAAIRPDFWILKTTLAVDFNFLNELNRYDLSQLYHIGAEVRFPKILSLQVGTQQEAITGGFGLDLWFIEINGATYVEEIGAYAGQKPDRRYVLQLALAF